MFRPQNCSASFYFHFVHCNVEAIYCALTSKFSSFCHWLLSTLCFFIPLLSGKKKNNKKNMKIRRLEFSLINVPLSYQVNDSHTFKDELDVLLTHSRVSKAVMLSKNQQVVYNDKTFRFSFRCHGNRWPNEINAPLPWINKKIAFPVWQ